jgi:hypothetical protein
MFERLSMPAGAGLDDGPVARGSRAAFLRKGIIAGGSLAGAAVLLDKGAVPAWAGDPGDGVPDVDVLNFALTLEYLEATFYTEALGGPGTTGVPGTSIHRSRRDHDDHHHHHAKAPFDRREISDARLFQSFDSRTRRSVYGNLKTIRDHEIAHVDFLRSALGSSAVGPCTFDFTGSLKSVASFIATAQVLENTGVMAYDGAIRYVDKGDYLQAGAQIATIEARHAAYLNLLERDSPFPDAFDMGKKPSEIIAAAKPFIVSCPPEVLALFGRLP